MSPENETRENYWEAVLKYLDPPEYISKNRTETADSNSNWQNEVNLDPITSQHIRPIKRGSSKRKQQKLKSRPISDLGFDIESDGLFPSMLSKSNQEISGGYQSIIDTVTGTKDGTGTKDETGTETKDGTGTKDETGTETKDGIETKDESCSDLFFAIEGATSEVENIPNDTEQENTADSTEMPHLTETETETNTPETGTEEPELTFLEVLRDSNWMKMGDPRKKKVRGIVINQIGNQVYVDYGHKFYGVFKIPEGMEPSQFQTGTKLLVRVTELELTQHFMGEDYMFSLLESGIEFDSLADL